MDFSAQLQLQATRLAAIHRPALTKEEQRAYLEAAALQRPAPSPAEQERAEKRWLEAILARKKAKYHVRKSLPAGHLCACPTSPGWTACGSRQCSRRSCQIPDRKVRVFQKTPHSCDSGVTLLDDLIKVRSVGAISRQQST